MCSLTSSPRRSLPSLHPHHCWAACMADTRRPLCLAGGGNWSCPGAPWPGAPCVRLVAVGSDALRRVSFSHDRLPPPPLPQQTPAAVDDAIAAAGGVATARAGTSAFHSRLTPVPTRPPSPPQRPPLCSSPGRRTPRCTGTTCRAMAHLTSVSPCTPRGGGPSAAMVWLSAAVWAACHSLRVGKMEGRCAVGLGGDHAASGALFPLPHPLLHSG